MKVSHKSQNTIENKHVGTEAFSTIGSNKTNQAPQS